MPYEEPVVPGYGGGIARNRGTQPRASGLVSSIGCPGWLGFTLIGVLAIAGLPPLNGFVSEWLLLQSFLFAHKVPHPFINMLLPSGCCVCSALAAAPRRPTSWSNSSASSFWGSRESPPCGTLTTRGLPNGLDWRGLRSGVLLLGFFLPSHVISLLSVVNPGNSIWVDLPASDAPWWLLVPIPDRQSSYAPLDILCQ